VVVDGKGEQLRPGLLGAKGDDPANVPPFDLTVAFQSRGASLHEIAANGNGRVELIQGSGRIDNSAVNRLVDDVTVQIFNAINPFRRQDPHTTLECGVYKVSIDDGVATIDPIAARTDRLTAVGSGQINFKNERINLTWSTQPRRGLGISASTLTNRFIQLGGTLSSPSINLDPTRAAITTGAAVATGGLSLLAEGLWDRVRAERDVCSAARKQLKSIGP
jgi:hypothetical protein